MTQKENDIHISALIDRPEHVRAIGMLTIEISNLERALAHLFGVVLGHHAIIAEAIYFTPRAAMARMDVISNVTPLCLYGFQKYIKGVDRIVARSKAVMGKRHNLIHDAWLLSEDGKEIARIENPFLQPPKVVTLAELNQTVEQVQILINDVMKLAFQIEGDQSVLASHRKRSQRWLSPGTSVPSETTL